MTTSLFGAAAFALFVGLTSIQNVAVAAPVVLKLELEITPTAAKRLILTSTEYYETNLIAPIVLSPFRTTVRYATDAAQIPSYLNPTPYTSTLLQGQRRLDRVDQGSEVVYYGNLNGQDYTLGQVYSNQLFDLGTEIERYYYANVSFSNFSPLTSTVSPYSRIIGSDEVDFLQSFLLPSAGQSIQWTEDVRTIYRANGTSDYLQDETMILGSARLLSFSIEEQVSNTVGASSTLSLFTLALLLLPLSRKTRNLRKSSRDEQSPTPT